MWKLNSKIFLEWKRIENLILNKADAVIGVSKPMVEKYREINPTKAISYIPCCVDTNLLTFDVPLREAIRKKYGWTDKIVFSYVGSIGINHWNNINQYAKFFEQVISSGINAHLLIITKDNRILIEETLRSRGIKPESLSIIEASSTEMKGWLSASDFGLQLMTKTADYETRLGVKFVEYLSVGLPVIVNVFAGAAARLVRENNLGLLWDETEKILQEKISSLLSDSEHLREQCMTYAQENFDVKKCSFAYRKIYHDLLGL
ncbi:hypothetical protein CCY01nite_10440 [Chitinophaga cymbidii]|uniref:Glycosyl transferase family 1 domain-containing protein n=2 Tax=Chitinophaga cymbidii TaxID=1096750 RepID=A0A512RGJ2_9BACT|nr:hypothetical protein CCY01nite_10440 [Chitinophaga cymbidii]